MSIALNSSARLHALRILITLSLFLSGLSIGATKPEEMPNVQLLDSTRFVSDPASELNPAIRQQIDRSLLDLRRRTTVEMAVAVVPDLEGESVEEYAEELFTLWGLGQKDRDNGVLLLLSPGSRKVRIQTGYGVEGALPDMIAKRIIEQEVVPAMKRGDINSAVSGATGKIVERLTDERFADELRSGTRIRNSQEEIDSKALRQTFIWLCALIVICSLIASIAIIIHTLRLTRKSTFYRKAEAWRSQLTWLVILAVTSSGLGIVTALYGWWRYRSNRDHSRLCHNCGTKMVKLDEASDNQYLSPAQDLEERLGSVDYDVWRCPHCGEVERFPFKEPRSKYDVCGNCGTRAYHLACTRTLKAPTTRSEGMGVREYRCEYCGYKHDVPFSIPRRADNTALLAAGAALGAASRRRGGGFGGGGFGGGGFGGGSTGGGGASGGW